MIVSSSAGSFADSTNDQLVKLRRAVTAQAVVTDELCELLHGVTVTGNDIHDTFLGTITNRLNHDSIFNEHGPHGSTHADDSMFNTDGRFGDDSSDYSANNPTASKPPNLWLGINFIGHMTANPAFDNGVSPYVVKGRCQFAYDHD